MGLRIHQQAHQTSITTEQSNSPRTVCHLLLIAPGGAYLIRFLSQGFGRFRVRFHRLLCICRRCLREREEVRITDIFKI